MELTAGQFLSSFASFAGMDQTAPPLTPPQPLLGWTLKQYRIESILGQGGMGVVHRAHERKGDIPVASGRDWATGISPIRIIAH